MSKLAIFYADDDQDDLMFFNDAVEKITMEVKNHVLLHMHVNGERLIENIKKNNNGNGIVFLDINMPFKTGLELLVEIRNEPEISQIPVIMYSTSSDPGNIQVCQNLGADFYVIKPSKFSDLEAMISKFIQINWQKYKINPNDFLYKS